MNMTAGLARTGLKPKIARILIISRADSRGIFDKIIHFNVQVGQLCDPGESVQLGAGNAPQVLS
ncbi:MAG: hypothetical protein MZV65_31310 [Chromatiales bacterium]|nr:hypothetical protein [Chromatiales bacterium]